MTDRRLAVDAWESLFRAQHEVWEEISSDFDDATLSQSEYDVLLTVTRAPDQTSRLRDITRLSLISQPSVSRLVDRMVSRGLVRKCADPQDGRGSLVIATPEGARLFHEIARRHAVTLSTRMAVLTDEELTQLRDLTAKLRGLDAACVEIGDIAGAGRPDA